MKPLIRCIGQLSIADSSFNDDSAEKGGGRLCTGYWTTDTNSCRFTGGTTTGQGGAVMMRGGTFSSTSDLFQRNTAGTEGGALFVGSGTAAVIDATFTSNKASLGGSIYTHGDFTTIDTQVILSNATNGGGIFVAAGIANISNCIIADNWTSTNGGGAYYDKAQSTSTSVTFDGNFACNEGAAFFINAGYHTFDECNTTNNCPGVDAVYNGGGNVTFIQHTQPTTSTSTTTTTEFIQESNCTVSCPSVTVIDQRVSSSEIPKVNITWIVIENTTNVQLTVTTSDNTTSTYQVGWGTIREVTSKDEVVKILDPVAEDLPRIIEANSTAVVIIYSAEETRPPWQDQPISVALTTVLTLQNNSKSVASAKFSLAIDGDWQFDSTSNKLEADFTVQASFRSVESCGKTEQYRLDSSEEEDVYHFGSDLTSAVELTILRGCLADGVHQDTTTLTPVFFNNDTAVNVTIRFPSFSLSLTYDPNFGLLLGYGDGSSSSCNSIFAWILPVAFLAGAGVIIVSAIVLSYVPVVRPLILGKEGMRVHKLREFVSDNRLSLDADMIDLAAVGSL